MEKFHILEVRGGKGTFREVEGEAARIGEWPIFIKAGDADGDAYFGAYDQVSGTRLSDLHDTKTEAIAVAAYRLSHYSSNDYERRREHFRLLYGRSPSAPEEEIEIIQEP